MRINIRLAGDMSGLSINADALRLPEIGDSVLGRDVIHSDRFSKPTPSGSVGEAIVRPMSASDSLDAIYEDAKAEAANRDAVSR
jgi:hypothetical protein